MLTLDSPHDFVHFRTQPAMEVRGSEIDYIINDIEGILLNLRTWVLEKPVSRCMVRITLTFS